MKKNFILLIILFVIINLFADGVQPIGSGTEANPYQVETLDNLLWISTNNQSWDKHFVQTADIDASDTQNWNYGAGFSPIGFDDFGGYYSFDGCYDGQDHLIDSLYIDRSEEYNLQHGLFGCANWGTITNLGITNAYVSGHSYVGVLIGTGNNVIISNCYSSGYVTGSGQYVGGLIGKGDNITLTNCYSMSTTVAYTIVQSNNWTGGLAGSLESSTISDCYSTGNISGDRYVGGLIGDLYSCTINNSYSTGSISGDNGVSGLLGYAGGNSTINNCYSTGNIIGEEELGGLIGVFGSINITNSYYNYESVTINGENIISIGGIENYIYSDWINNNLNLNIEDYLTLNNNEYLISNVSDLKTILAFGLNNYQFLLINDIDLSSDPGFYIPYFIGRFNGNNHFVDNLNILINSIGLGLFGFIRESIITNLNIQNANITGMQHLGVLVGTSLNSTINNCSSEGNIIGTGSGGLWSEGLGGLVGSSSNSSINDCNSNGVISAIAPISISGWQKGIGGLVGHSSDASNIQGCYSVCTVEGGYGVGGFVGKNVDSYISNSFSTGNVMGEEYIGGLVGSNAEGIVNKCYSTGTVDGGIDYIGGLIGSDYLAVVSNSFWDIETSTQATSAGGSGKTTAEMQSVATYTDLSTAGLENPWDFVGNPFDDTGNEDYWNIDPETNNGYPFFANPYIINDANEIPETKFTIENYPNPFNPSTTIEFSIQNDSKIDLSVFNIKGQKIKTLTNNEFAKGSHSIIWNGVDELGKSISSGIYFYKLKVNGKTEAVKKCLLLK